MRIYVNFQKNRFINEGAKENLANVLQFFVPTVLYFCVCRRTDVTINFYQGLP